ncbi:unnamed protein product [Microthlaspi erraticum]|uniref:Uncharacterized protein n=1 Tax=Microthlaspi erraticum TaxID=1685480 RepID=A0A6D2ITH2_9BRAS|nr:unnamed protein product [Microthlaspi erraticum]CAA7029926.1 unnamed protein product [Microthlaspi erraticum]
MFSTHHRRQRQQTELPSPSPFCLPPLKYTLVSSIHQSIFIHVSFPLFPLYSLRFFLLNLSAAVIAAVHGCRCGIVRPYSLPLTAGLRCRIYFPGQI